MAAPIKPPSLKANGKNINGREREENKQRTMNSVFSVDDLSDLWDSPAMYRSASEWDMQRLLEDFTGTASSFVRDNNAAPSMASQSSRPGNGDDEVVDIRKSQIHLPAPPLTHPQPSDRTPPAAPIDSEQYRALLESELDLARCAMAISWESSEKGGDIPSVARDQRLVANNFLLEFQASSGVRSGMPAAQSGTDGGTLNTTAAPSMQKKVEFQTRQTTSGSSKDDSDDDLEGDTGTNKHTDPADVTRARRMQSNRESARRSRKRKQVQLNELETQVGQLIDERTSLLSRRTDINKKHDEAIVNYRILRANIETLRAKVKMAEEQVKRVTGWNPMLTGRSIMPSMGGQIGGQVDATGTVTGPMHPNSNQFFHQPQSVHIINSATSHCQRLDNGFPASTMVAVAPNPLQTASGKGTTNMLSMQHVQKGE